MFKKKNLGVSKEPMDMGGMDDAMGGGITMEDMAQSVAHHKAVPIQHARKMVVSGLHQHINMTKGVRIGKKKY